MSFLPFVRANWCMYRWQHDLLTGGRRRKHSHACVKYFQVISVWSPIQHAIRFCYETRASHTCAAHKEVIIINWIHFHPKLRAMTNFGFNSKYTVTFCSFRRVLKFTLKSHRIVNCMLRYRMCDVAMFRCGAVKFHPCYTFNFIYQSLSHSYFIPFEFLAKAFHTTLTRILAFYFRRSFCPCIMQ